MSQGDAQRVSWAKVLESGMALSDTTADIAIQPQFSISGFPLKAGHLAISMGYVLFAHVVFLAVEAHPFGRLAIQRQQETENQTDVQDNH